MIGKRLSVASGLAVGFLATPFAAFAAESSTGEEAHAAGGEHAVHHVGLDTLFWPTANFSIYALIVIYLYRKHGTKMLRGRSAQIENHVNRASAALADAEAQFQNSNERLQAIDDEKSSFLETYREEGHRMAASVLQSARESAQRIDHDASRLIASEFSRTEKELRNHVVTVATEQVRERLTRELTAEDDKALRRRALESLS